MEIDWIDALIKMTLACIVIVIYGMTKIGTENIRQFSLSKFVKENKGFWTWAGITLILVLILFTLEPGAGNTLKEGFGLDVNGERTSFITLGYFLAKTANNITKNPIGVKPPELDKKDNA